MHGQEDAAESVLIKLHRKNMGESSDRLEFLAMKAQIDLEMETRIGFRQIFRTPALRRRFLTGWVAMSGTQFSGVIILLSLYFKVYYVIELANLWNSLPECHLRIFGI